MANCENCRNFEPRIDASKIMQAWEERKRLCVEGNKLCAEGDKLYAESRDKLHAKGNRLYAEGNKLHARGNILRADGDLIFINAVLEVYENVKILWNGESVTVDGVKYE